MRSVGIFLIILFFIAGTALFGSAAAETLTFTTYYPSPFGSYNQLEANLFHLKPRACQANECDEGTEEGKMCYDQSDHEEKVCMPTSTGGYEWKGQQGITAMVNIPFINAGESGSGQVVITVIGARENDVVTLGPPDNWQGGTTVCCCGYSAFVSSDDRVTFKFASCCESEPCHINSGSWKVHLSK